VISIFGNLFSGELLNTYEFVLSRGASYEFIQPGEALVLFRERAEPGDEHAVAYRHRDVHLGYVPRQHRWIADAIDDGLRLFAIVEIVKTGWFFRRRAASVHTRIIVLWDGR
jgi:HIRAN domain